MMRFSNHKNILIKNHIHETNQPSGNNINSVIFIAIDISYSACSCSHSHSGIVDVYCLAM